MTRRKHTSKFKFKVVLEALSERFTIQQLGRKYEIHPTEITNWKAHFLKNAEEVFSKKAKDAKTQAEEREEGLLKTIGQQKVELDFLKKALS